MSDFDINDPNEGDVPSMPVLWSQLDAMSEEELVEVHNRYAPMTLVDLKDGFTGLLQEITRRRTMMQADRMERLTLSVERMTRTIKWLTAVSVMVGAVALITSVVALWITLHQ